MDFFQEFFRFSTQEMKSILLLGVALKITLLKLSQTLVLALVQELCQQRVSEASPYTVLEGQHTGS